MPIAVKQFQPTPNPHAIKCVLSQPVGSYMRSYRAPAEGASDPLAVALFAIPGVVGLLIAPDWITVTKTPEASWTTLQKQVSKVLSGLSSVPAPQATERT